ncbi:4-alpha-glucanotransferase [Sphingomonas endophytica]|uniref:4-alpha-glucanotransferase n=1 Tax=Sphingomonas endophytica TaxID=869719 RepID=A0ABR6N410_9SPHN|nr:4-alpha-glucanotransferase [Sphingomonas endophytica]MBB5725524.1 4-alpha-glucanotransferase [Sphingomonas endophytica]
MTLSERAAAAGLSRDWEDADGRPQRVADEVLEAILGCLDTTSPGVPFLSADAGRAIDLPAGVTGDAELLLDDGNRLALTIAADGTLPPVERVGYHRLHAGGREYTLAIAPRRCALPKRGWGVAVQVPSLRASTDSAFGDAGALVEAAASFARVGAQALAISPTHALFPADPTRFSPYSPSTRLFHNVLLADPALIGLPLPPARATPLIDWPQAARERIAQLRTAFELASEGALSAARTHRRQRGAALEAHARFDALHAALGGHGWQDWPAAYHDPNGEAVIRFAAEHEREVAFYAFLQWLVDLGLATAQRTAKERMTTGIVADLAVGMDAGGSHAWSARDELLTGLTVGAPPDPLGPDGQNWGITALDPFALQRTGFRAFIETLRVALAHAGGIRIDHALGLERLWVIPAGADASEGAYLRMPGAHLRRIVAIEAHRADAVVIAEDLGTVPAGFRDTLAARCMLGMRVLPFERDAEGGFVPSAEWDEAAVAMTGTHDTPTLAGWWKARDIDWAEQLGRSGADRARRAAERAALWQAMDKPGDPPAAPPVDAMIAHVASAPCPLAIVPLEDLLALEEQPNLPGTIDEHPNWRRRMDASTPALLARRDVARRIALLNAERHA